MSLETVAPTAVQSGPFVPTVPTKLLACNWDMGGSGLAFNQTTSGNSGATYRTDGGGNLKKNTDTATASDWVVGWGSTGTWYLYTFNVNTQTDTAVTLRVASQTGGTLHVSFDGTDSPKVTVPASGTWDSADAWKDVSSNVVSLSPGLHKLKVTIDSSWVDLAAMTLSSSSTAPPDPGPGPGPGPGNPPVPYPGNKVVQVAPGDGTLVAAFKANGANTTFQLAAGTYTVSTSGNQPAFQVKANQQLFGVNPDMNTDKTIIKITGWSGGWGLFDDTAGGDSTNFQIWGITGDLNGAASGFGRFTQLFKAGGKVKIQNSHFINITSSVKGQERFILHMDTSCTVDSCRFGYTTGGVDGHTTITQGTVTNCKFDHFPTGGGTYFHCVGLPCNVSGCTWDGSSVTGECEFIYGEPGNGISPNQLSGTYKFTGNTCNMGGGNACFLGLQFHSNFPANSIPGTFLIDSNTISNGIVLRTFGVINNPAINGTVQITHNTLSQTTMTQLNGGQVTHLITSPNP